MKTLLVVDGNSIVNRAYFGVKGGLSTSRGIPTNAVFGFINILTKMLDEYRPDKAAVAFDVHAPTFRHKMFDGYKVGRHPMPDDLKAQMPYAKRAAEALGFTSFEREGYEADDILGTYAELGEQNGYRVYLLTGDRDSLQLISDTTSVILASKGEYPLFNRAKFESEYGIKPEQFVDLKAIMGDSSDCYPGVPGIGEKGALELIQQFGTLDAVFENYSNPEYKVKKGAVAKLDEGRDSAYLSKTLATIFRQVDLPAPDELAPCEMDRGEAKKLFRELEFDMFIRKYGLDKDETCQCTECTAEFSDVSSLKSVLNDNVAVSYYDGYVYAYDGKTIYRAPENRDVLAEIAAAAQKLCTYDAKSFGREACRFGVNLRGFGFDVMLGAYVIDPQAKNSVSDLVTIYLGDIANSEMPDAYYIYRIKPVIEAKLNESGAYKLFNDIEMPLSDVLCDMETEGFLIDLEGLSKYGEKLAESIDALTQAIYFGAGCEFNINSPKQLGEVLFEKMGLPYDGKKKGQYSTAADVLEKLAPYSEVVADILEYRKLTKLLGTYVQGLGNVADADGRIHTSFRQTGTATGRLSSAEPNLQNIPVRTEEGRELRRLFMAGPGKTLVDADYSQIELRLLAAISGDERMIEAFSSGKDIHASTASTVFRIPIEQVTPELRKRAKAVNFGIVYGIGAYSLSQDIGVTQKQAKQYIEDYLAGYPGVSSYLDDVVEQAKKDGYVTTIHGRRRYIPEIKAQNVMLRKFGERVAMNSPIQGSAADIIKIAMINVSKRLKAELPEAHLILTVHDELLIEVPEAQADDAAKILQEGMESAANMAVKLSVEVSIGQRWPH